ncbi:MAG: hybrid sensor histidine kinase/response regulator [Desulfomonilaceae bacterium]
MEQDLKPSPSTSAWIGALLLAVIIIVTGGYAYYLHEAQRIRHDKYEDIATIAKLKAGQISNWRQERLQDVRRDAGSPLFRKAVEELVHGPTSQALQTQLKEFLAVEVHAQNYDNALLLDPTGAVLLSAKPELGPVNEAVKRAVEDALTTHSATISELYRSPQGAVQIDAVAPILDSAGITIAVIDLISDAGSVLYPLIQSWPVPSSSSETLLIRKDGSDVLFLNNLRYNPKAALSLREPLTAITIPAVQAVLGKSGLFEGLDYRGVEVLADLRPVPKSPWFMVAKVDTSEILAEARYRGEITALFVVVFILLASAMTAYFYRVRQTRLYRDLYRSEREKLEIEEEFRTTLYSIGDAVITTDHKGSVKVMNPVAEQLTGLSESEANGKPLEEVFSIINEDSREKVENPAQRVLREGIIVGLANHTILISNDGTERPIADSGAPIRDKDGAVNGVVLVFRDQTQERAAQKALREQHSELQKSLKQATFLSDLIERSSNALRLEKDKLKSILDNMNDAVRIVSSGHEIEYINRSMEADFGPVSGRKCYEYFRDSLAPCENCDNRRFFGNEPSHCEWLSEKANKTYEIFDTPIHNADGSISMLAIFHDITHRKIIEEEKEKLQAQLLQSQKMEAIGTLAGGIAHDFNNLLQVILGYSELMIGLKKADDRELGDLQKIHQSARSGAELVRRLMIFSRKIEPKFVPVDLNHLIMQTQEILARTIPKMIDIHLDLSSDISQINADPTQIEQILMNLAVNARDAMPEGGRINIATNSAILDEDYCKEHTETKPGEFVLLTVTDTGQGMDKETVKRIFEPFFTTKDLGRGTGLGLAVVYGIVQQHGGHIWCYSEPSRGTVFKIYFPALVSREEPEQKMAELIPHGGTETILLVDDEESVRFLARTTLAKAGYTLLTAGNGEEALSIYHERGKEISLVILDLMMPKMGGAQCLNELLKMDPTVKVIIASGHSGEGGREEYTTLGAKGFIEKPYESRILLNIVRSALDSD